MDRKSKLEQFDEYQKESPAARRKREKSKEMNLWGEKQ
jgi:hypothetical protein